MKPKMLSAALALILLVPVTSTATPLNAWATCQDDSESVAIAKALAELEGRRKEVAALKDVVKAKDEHIAALQSALDATEKAMAKWKEAAEARSDANTADARIEESYRTSLAALDKELTRVREERDSARRSRWYFAFGGAVVGVLIVLASKGGGN